MLMKHFFESFQYGGRNVFHGTLVGKPNKNSLVLELLLWKGVFNLWISNQNPILFEKYIYDNLILLWKGEFFFAIQCWVLSTMWTCQVKYWKKVSKGKQVKGILLRFFFPCWERRLLSIRIFRIFFNFLKNLIITQTQGHS